MGKIGQKKKKKRFPSPIDIGITIVKYTPHLRMCQAVQQVLDAAVSKRGAVPSVATRGREHRQPGNPESLELAFESLAALHEQRQD